MKAVSTKTGIVSWGAPGTTNPAPQELFICRCGKTSPFANLKPSGPSKFMTVTYHCPSCNKLLAAKYDPEKWDYE